MRLIRLILAIILFWVGLGLLYVFAWLLQLSDKLSPDLLGKIKEEIENDEKLKKTIVDLIKEIGAIE